MDADLSQSQSWQETRNIQRDPKYQTFYIIMGGLFLVLIGVLIGYALFVDDAGLSLNLFTEVISVAFTIVVLDRLNAERARRQLQQQIVMNVGSLSNEVALDAIHQLKQNDWLEGENSLLRKANLAAARLSTVDLMNADLNGANLERVNLESANLKAAKLEGANLRFSNLRSSDFTEAKLCGANISGANMNKINLLGANLYQALVHADLREATLSLADFRAADLRVSNLAGAICIGTDFRGTNMINVNLTNAVLAESLANQVYQAKFDETTILPDGTYWTPDTDMTRFTDPNHPNFWRSTHWQDDPT